MLPRQAEHTLHERLRRFPAVVLVGPRQVGKTTMARAVAGRHPGAAFFDLERESDRAALRQPELLLPTLRDRLVVLDEVQLAPGLFAALRPEIDDDRRPGRFLLLGCASGELLRQSAKSLAGRATTVELTPFLASELQPDLPALQSLWLRGGYPLSWLAADDAASYEWRAQFLRTFLQRDLPALGVRVPAETLRRFWTMLAHLQGQLFNASQLGAALGGAAHTTVGRYLDTLVDALMVRRLQPVLPNVGKRLVKSPKVYVRDSGLLHALLGITDVAALQGHPVAGASWEGFVVEQVAGAMPADATLGFYRTAAGAEIDLVVEHRGRRVGFEVKFSAAPRPARGFWQALEDLRLERAFVVAPVARRHALEPRVEVVGLNDWRVPWPAPDPAGFPTGRVAAPRRERGLRQALDDLQLPRVFASFGRQRFVAMALALRVERPRVMDPATARGADRAVRRVTRFVGARHSRSAAGDAFGQRLRIRARCRVSCVTDAPARGAGTAFA